MQPGTAKIDSKGNVLMTLPFFITKIMKNKISVTKKISTNKSPIKRIYMLLKVNSPDKLWAAYMKEDQKLMRSQKWDYKNKSIKINKIKEIFEKVDARKLTKEERVEQKEILWMWYHHATGYAIWKYKSKATAKSYSGKAIKYQSKDHPNKVTRLLYYLTRDQLVKAENWAKKNQRGQDTALISEVIKLYKNDGFFK